MQGATKTALGLFIGWLLFGGSSAKKSATPKSSPEVKKPAKKKASPGGEKRPEDAKPEPGPNEDLSPRRGDDIEENPEDVEAAEEKAKKKKKAQKPPTGGTSTTAETSAPAGKKKRGKHKSENAAADLAESLHKAYLDRGIEDQIAASEALTLYMLAGGSDPAQIKHWQGLMGVEPSGGYDKETSTVIARDIGMAIDSAINEILQQEFSGEDPQKAAGVALLRYLNEARDITEAVPREKLAALQIAMGIPSEANGRYDQATKDRLVELGLVPEEHTINSNFIVVD